MKKRNRQPQEIVNNKGKISFFLMISVLLAIVSVVGLFTAVKVGQQRQEIRSDAHGGGCNPEHPECYKCLNGRCVAWNPLAEHPGDGMCKSGKCTEGYTGTTGACCADGTIERTYRFPDCSTENHCGGPLCSGGSQPSPSPPGSECTSDGDCSSGECCNYQTCGSCEEPPGGSSTPTPTPTPTPPPGLVCSEITMSTAGPTVGHSVDFTCSGSGSVIDHYEFQYSIDDGAWVEIPKPGFGNGQTVSMTVNQMGDYVVRCRACTSIDSSKCTNYQTL